MFEMRSLEAFSQFGENVALISEDSTFNIKADERRHGDIYS